ncbi:MAG: glycosyltransferase [Planctomycetota bacterium]
MEFSVVIPTTGRSERIGDVLGGLRLQDRPATEVIFVLREDDTTTADRLEELGGDLPLRIVRVDRPGLIAALNVGLRAVRTELVAFTDDDAVPGPDWLAALGAHFERDPRVGGVGGRDNVWEDGGEIPPGANRVGRLSWFGRMGGEHHRGMGGPRDVDFLKGVCMSYRTIAAQAIGFDERLLGGGCQVANEISLALPLRWAGWRLVYDPRIVIQHYPASRPSGDERLSRDPKYLRDAAFNEALLIGEHVGRTRRLVFLMHAWLVGTRRHYGMVQALRFLRQRGVVVFREWKVTAAGRWAGVRARRRHSAATGYAGQRGRQDGAVRVPAREAANADLRVSVVVPTLGRLDRVRLCLAGLAEQSRLPDEVVVVVREDDTVTAEGLAEDLASGCYDGLVVRVCRVSEPGVIAALEAGVAEAEGDVIAFTDDDAVPRPGWLATLLPHFANPGVGGVGGRDWVVEDGELQDGSAAEVGRVRWWGGLVGNHHLGVGPAREVDTLKGCSMAFRREVLEKHGFDRRMRGPGAQVANELAPALAARKAGWRIVYDPSAEVDHNTAPRQDADHRWVMRRQQISDAAFNEALAVLGYLPRHRRLVFLAWALLVGSRRQFGLLQAVRFLPKYGKESLGRWRATAHGRLAAALTR